MRDTGLKEKVLKNQMNLEQAIQAALIDAYRNGWSDGASNRRNMEKRYQEDLEGNHHRCERLAKHIVKKYPDGDSPPDEL